MTASTIKIIHIVHQYLPEFVGGTEHYTRTLAEYQAKAGHSVAIFSPATSNSEWPQASVEKDVRVYRYPTGPRSRRQVFFDTFRESSIEQSFATVLEREKPDLVHSQHNMGLPISIVPFVEASGAKFLITIHDYWYACANAQLITNYDHTICDGPDRLFINCGRCAAKRAGFAGDRWFAPGMAPIMAYRNRKLRKLLSSADRVIFPSQFTKQIYEDMALPVDKSVVVPHAIDKPEALSEVGIEQRSTKPDPIAGKPRLRIGYVGSIAWQKGLHILVEAANRLPQDDVSIDIYGSLSTYADYSAKLQQMNHHAGLKFHGQVDHNRLWSELARLHLLVIPTLWYECSPLTIQEAFAAKVPLVASRIGAVEENIRDGIDGILFPPGDANALFDVLMELYQHPEKVASLRRAIKPVRPITAHIADVAREYSVILGIPVHI